MDQRGLNRTTMTTPTIIPAGWVRVNRWKSWVRRHLDWKNSLGFPGGFAKGKFLNGNFGFSLVQGIFGNFSPLPNLREERSDFCQIEMEIPSVFGPFFVGNLCSLTIRIPLSRVVSILGVKCKKRILQEILAWLFLYLHADVFFLNLGKNISVKLALRRKIGATTFFCNYEGSGMGGSFFGQQVEILRWHTYPIIVGPSKAMIVDLFVLPGLCSRLRMLSEGCKTCSTLISDPLVRNSAPRTLG